MFDHRPFASLGRFKINWLEARYHFSFSDYFDPRRMNWGPLRVWNDDIVQPKSGFPPHGHRDMEIITYVRSGAISHGDSLGNKGRTEAGQVQVMSAGSGIQHAEYNLEDTETTHFQIWIEPDTRNLKPRWETRSLPGAYDHGRFIPLVSGQGIPDVMTIHQDATLYVAHLQSGDSLTHALGRHRKAYLVSSQGSGEVAGISLAKGDGLAVADEENLTLTAQGPGTFILADLPA